MKKRELYDALASAGVKLKDYNRMSTEQLETMMEQLNAKREKPEKPAVPPLLEFEHAGWCNELGRSYFVGFFQASSMAEYDALKKYAKGGEK